MGYSNFYSRLTPGQASNEPKRTYSALQFMGRAGQLSSFRTTRTTSHVSSCLVHNIPHTMLGFAGSLNSHFISVTQGSFRDVTS